MSRTGWWHSDGRVRSESDIYDDVADELGYWPSSKDFLHWTETNGWEPLESCTTCERRLPDDSGYPICPPCVGTAKAHARIGMDPDAEYLRAVERGSR